MNLLFAVLLAVPLLGGLAALLLRERRLPVAQVVGAAVALGWVVLVVATSGTEPTRVALGRLEVDPLAAAALAGAALLVGARPPARTLGVSTALTGLTVFAAAATVTQTRPSDRPLAAGMVVLTALALVRCRAAGASRSALLALTAGGLAATVGLALGDAESAAVVVLVGAAAVAVVVVPSGLPGLQLLPVVLLAAHRTVTTPRSTAGLVAGPIAGPMEGPLDPVLVTGVAVALLAAGALLVTRDRPAADRVPAAVAVSALVLFATDLSELRQAGLLLAAGGVLAVAGRHPVALLAVLPGVVAAVDAAGVATEPEHAAAGAAVLIVLGAASGRYASPGATDGAAHDRTDRWWAAPAVVFGLIPAWGWAGVDLPAYTEAVAVSGAVGFAVVAAIAAGPTLVLAVRDRLSDRRTGSGDPPDESRDEPTPPSSGPSSEPDPDATPPGEGEPAIRPRGVRIVARRSVPADPPDGIPHPDD